MVAFQCNPGLAPSQQMMSVCAANGSWTPDPAELVCMLPPPGILNAVCRVRSCCFVPVSKINIKQALQTALVKRKPKNVLTPCTHLLVHSVSSIVYAGDCGVPASPTSGTVAYTTTTEGSLATFQCSAGLVPGEVMTAVCENSTGTTQWSPDPGDLSCGKPYFLKGFLLFWRKWSCSQAITLCFLAWLGNKNMIN